MQTKVINCKIQITNSRLNAHCNTTLTNPINQYMHPPGKYVGLVTDVVFAIDSDRNLIFVYLINTSTILLRVKPQEKGLIKTKLKTKLLISRFSQAPCK